jgi:hypothetical protein
MHGRRWVILVARDQPGLWAHLVTTFAADDLVRVATVLAEDAPRHSAKIRRGLRARSAVLVPLSEFQWRYGASR